MSIAILLMKSHWPPYQFRLKESINLVLKVMLVLPFIPVMMGSSMFNWMLLLLFQLMPNSNVVPPKVCSEGGGEYLKCIVGMGWWHVVYRRKFFYWCWHIVPFTGVYVICIVCIIQEKRCHLSDETLFLVVVMIWEWWSICTKYCKKQLYDLACDGAFDIPNTSVVGEFILNGSTVALNARGAAT